MKVVKTLTLNTAYKITNNTGIKYLKSTLQLGYRTSEFNTSHRETLREIDDRNEFYAVNDETTFLD